MFWDTGSEWHQEGAVGTGQGIGLPVGRDTCGRGTYCMGSTRSMVTLLKSSGPSRFIFLTTTVSCNMPPHQPSYVSVFLVQVSRIERIEFVNSIGRKRSRPLIRSVFYVDCKCRWCSSRNSKRRFNFTVSFSLCILGVLVQEALFVAYQQAEGW